MPHGEAQEGARDHACAARALLRAGCSQEVRRGVPIDHQRDGTGHKEVRTYSAMTNELLALADWLRGEDCGPVVMESTGSYWRPVFNLLEEQCEVLVVNAYHAKAVPGRKTDVKDAEWLADLLRHGLLRAELHPAPAAASPARPHALSYPPGRRASAAHQPAADGAGGCQYQARPRSSPTCAGSRRARSCSGCSRARRTHRR